VGAKPDAPATGGEKPFENKTGFAALSVGTPKNAAPDAAFFIGTSGKVNQLIGLGTPGITGSLAQQLDTAFGAPAAALGTNPEARLRVVLCDRQGRHLIDELIDAHGTRLGDLLKALALVGGECE
jgi:hypothetical protein